MATSRLARRPMPEIAPRCSSTSASPTAAATAPRKSPRPRRRDLRPGKRKPRRLFALKRRTRHSRRCPARCARRGLSRLPSPRSGRSPSYRPRQVRDRADTPSTRPPRLPCASSPPRISGNGWRRNPFGVATKRHRFALEHNPLLS